MKLELSRWQRIKRRFSLLGGGYIHPDGYIELDFHEAAGITRHDNSEECAAKLARYEDWQATRRRQGFHATGAFFIGLGTYYIAGRLGFGTWDAIGVAAQFALGTFLISR